MFEIKKGTNQFTNCQAYSSTRFCRKHWKKTSNVGKTKKRNGNMLERHRSWLLHKHEVCRRRALFCILQWTASKNLVRIQEKFWKSGSQIHPETTKILSNQSSQSSDTKKGMELVFKKSKYRQEEKAWDPWARWLRSCNRRRPKSNPGCLGDIPQVQAGADIEKLHAQTSTPAVRRSDNFDDMLRIRNMAPTKEHERMIHSTQRKMLRLIIQRKIRYKKDRATKSQDQRRKYTKDSSCTDNGSEDG